MAIKRHKHKQHRRIRINWVSVSSFLLLFFSLIIAIWFLYKVGVWFAVYTFLDELLNKFI